VSGDEQEAPLRPRLRTPAPYQHLPIQDHDDDTVERRCQRAIYDQHIMVVDAQAAQRVPFHLDIEGGGGALDEELLEV
jgi:hypothetical protein